jgi:putative spermidine/putrescine transport system substrate-binding protein
MNKKLMAAVVLSALSVGASAVHAQDLNSLIKAAKQEGELTTIALPHDWCGYGDLVAGFKAKYGIKVNELNPDAGSGDEVEAIKANKGNKGPQAPDVIDVGLSFGPQAKEAGLIQPYKVSTWNSIPAEVKDKDGYWYGDYYGVLAFEVNTDIIKKVPADWADLLKPEYKNAVALAGDPRTANQAIMGVYAAGLSQAGGNPAKAADAGLKFFSQLNKNGNFVPVIGKAASLAQGTTPIIALGLQRPGRPRHPEGQPESGRGGAEVRRGGRRVRTGHQRLRPAPECRQAVDGIPVLRRRPTGLAEGLLPPQPLQRPGCPQESTG